MTSPRVDLEISLASIVVATKDQVSSELGGDTVLLHLKSAHYFGFAGVGSRIWALLEEPRRLSSIRDSILEEFEVTPDQCERDLLRFVRELRDKGLVEVRSGA